MTIPSTKPTKQSKNRTQLTKMSSTSKTTPVAQTPSQPVKEPVAKTPSQPVLQAPTLIGRDMGVSVAVDCYHDWVLCAHPTIPYTALFCQHCGVEKQ